MPSKFVVELTAEQLQRLIGVCEDMNELTRQAMKGMDPKTEQEEIVDAGRDYEFVQDIQDHLTNTYQEGK